MLSAYTPLSKCLSSLRKQRLTALSGSVIQLTLDATRDIQRLLNHGAHGCKSCIMRNPDKWQPPDPDESSHANSRRAALVGLLVILLLVGGALLVTHILGKEAKFQDCSISGRANCADGR